MTTADKIEQGFELVCFVFILYGYWEVMWGRDKPQGKKRGRK